MLFSPDGTTLIAGGTAGMSSILRLIDLERGRELLTIPDVDNPLFSPRGNLVATREVVRAKVVTIQETRTGRELATLPHTKLGHV